MLGWIVTLVFGLTFLLLSYALSDSLATVFFSLFYLIGIAATAIGGIGVLVKIALSYA